MDSMREIRSRMSSIQKTMKITNAMYLMASSRLKKARAKLALTEPYFNKLQYVIVDILAHTDEGKQRYFATDRDIPEEQRKVAYIVITSDKGLAGAYNLNVNRLTEHYIRSSKTMMNKLFFVGFSGRKYFSKRPELGEIDMEHCYGMAEPEIWRARKIAEYVTGEFLNGDLDEVYVVYTKMKNALTAEPERLRLLPLVAGNFPVKPMEDERTYSTDYEPSPLAVLDKVVPNYVKGMLYGAMVEAFASEQNARMTAMQNATDNAEEIVRELSLQYNRVRQAAITTELNEVVAGANAQEQ